MIQENYNILKTLSCIGGYIVIYKRKENKILCDEYAIVNKSNFDLNDLSRKLALYPTRKTDEDFIQFVKEWLNDI